MSRDKATEATLRMLKPTAPVAMATVSEMPSSQPDRPLSPMPEPEMVLVRKTVANSAARTMVYMTPAMKRKFKEIAYFDRCKENDLWLEAAHDFLRKKGHTV